LKKFPIKDSNFNTIYPLSSEEKKEISSNIAPGIFGIFILLAIGFGFTSLFMKEIPPNTIFGKIFAYLPAFSSVSISIFLIFKILNYYFDVKFGYKIKIEGIISRKFTRSINSSGSNLTRLSERTRHFIVIDNKKYLISGLEYNRCSEKDKVCIYITKYGKTVLGFEIIRF